MNTKREYTEAIKYGREVKFMYFDQHYFAREASMKKVIVSLITFIIMFIATYLILCYFPSFRIKLFAPPMEYFIESIKHMVFFKILVSVVMGLLVAGIPFIIQRRAK